MSRRSQVVLVVSILLVVIYHLHQVNAFKSEVDQPKKAVQDRHSTSNAKGPVRARSADAVINAAQKAPSFWSWAGFGNSMKNLGASLGKNILGGAYAGIGTVLGDLTIKYVFNKNNFPIKTTTNHLRIDMSARDYLNMAILEEEEQSKSGDNNVLGDVDEPNSISRSMIRQAINERHFAGHGNDKSTTGGVNWLDLGPITLTVLLFVVGIIGLVWLVKKIRARDDDNNGR